MSNRDPFNPPAIPSNGPKSLQPPFGCRHDTETAREQTDITIRGQSLTLMFQERTLCEHLDFDVRAGFVTVLAPRDTLCKMALLNLLAGRLRPLAGRCLIEDTEAHSLPLAVKQRVGMLENVERPYEVMTIGQTALFFSGCYPEWHNEIYYRLTDSFGVSRRVKISNLSNVQRALVALAVLLARNPDVLILDDWITTIGEQTRDIVHEAIHRYSEQPGKTTLLVGHHVGLTPHLIDQLILLGHSTSLVLPTVDLFGTAIAAHEDGKMWSRFSGDLEPGPTVQRVHQVDRTGGQKRRDS